MPWWNNDFILVIAALVIFCSAELFSCFFVDDIFSNLPNFLFVA